MACRYPSLVRHITLVNYFPDFLLLTRDVVEPSTTVAQRQADAKTLQQQIAVILDSLRCVWQLHAAAAYVVAVAVADAADAVVAAAAAAAA